MVPKPPKDRRGLRIVGKEAQRDPKEDLVQLTIRLPLSKRRDLHMRATEYDMTVAEFVQTRGVYEFRQKVAVYCG